ncbi:hypothetical protein BGZ59_003883 [Podila verticillata]|nr:hypothetical protein BGZ59_003883 [Podila verticillata]KFH63998.1 hypothetical protein MVEG_09823 [Podila verticillata NRRL 6337]
MGRKSGRSLNPADQYRKEQHKKEIKKNKQDRKKVRELGSAIKDTTTEVELSQHEELEKAGKLDKEGLKKLAELRDKMTKINDIKKAHGIKIKPKKIETQPVSVEEQLRDPTRSIYYDPVLNPYGAPPPGMPYLEHPPLPTELPFGQEPPQPPEGSEDESEEDTDSSDSGSDSSSSSGSDSEDIDDESYMPPLPEGPAPSKEDQVRFLAPTKPRPAIDLRIEQHGQMMGPRGALNGHGPPGGPLMNPYGPPPNFMPSPYGNVYPPGRPGPPPLGFVPPPPMQVGYGGPPPGFHGPPGYQGPPGFQGPPPHHGYGGPPSYGGQQGHPQDPHGGYEGRQNRPPTQRPPPRYVKPVRTANPQSDPMTGHLPPDEKEISKQLAAAEKAASATDSASTATEALNTPTHHPLPPKPFSSTSSKPVVQAGPTSISAEPQLRNLQKELVHLVPSTIMRKRVTQKGKIGKPVNAAPGVDVDDVPSASTHGSSSIPVSSSSTSSTKASGGGLVFPFANQPPSSQQGDDSDEDYRESGLGLRLPRINLAPNVQVGPRKIVVNSAPNVPAAEPDRAAKKKAEYDDFMQSLEGDGLL